jgi:hypothetical protein
MSTDLILVFYCGVAHLSPEETREYMDKLINNVQPNGKEAGITRYFIPVQGTSETRVECLNPTFITNDKLNKSFLKKLRDVDRKLDRVTSTLFTPTRSVIIEKM